MKRIIKIMALALTAVMLIAVLPVTASAASIADTAKKMSLDTEYEGTLKELEDYADYKITITKSGTLTIDAELSTGYGKMNLYDADLNLVKPDKVSQTKGDIAAEDNVIFGNYYSYNDYPTEHEGYARYVVKKGTYYLRVQRLKLQGLWNNDTISTGEYILKATFKADAVPEIQYITVKVAKGSKLELGTVMTASGGTVTWKSGATKVATVSSKGVVKALKKGTAVITATCGDSKMKLQVKVV